MNKRLGTLIAALALAAATELGGAAIPTPQPQPQPTPLPDLEAVRPAGAAPCGHRARCRAV